MDFNRMTEMLDEIKEGYEKADGFDFKRWFKDFDIGIRATFHAVIYSLFELGADPEKFAENLVESKKQLEETYDKDCAKSDEKYQREREE